MLENVTHLVDVSYPNVVAADIEVYREASAADFWDEDYVAPGWNKDVEGTGLIVYVYEGKRTWVKTSLSKTPFTALRKQLLTNASETLKHVYVIRGNIFYPLMDTEIKTLSALIMNRLKDTNIAGFSSYTSMSSLPSKTMTVLNHVVDNLVGVMSDDDYDLTVQASDVVEGEMRNGTTIFSGAGFTATVSIMLKDETDPSQGAGFVSVRLNDLKGQNLLTSTVGSLLKTLAVQQGEAGEVSDTVDPPVEP